MYYYCRDHEHVYFFNYFELKSADSKCFLNNITGNLPSFIHSYSFSLLSIISLPYITRRISLYFCIFWICINSFFEIGQIYTGHQSNYPFEGLPWLENILPYFADGVFDPWDIAYVILGGTGAYLTIYILVKEDEK